MRIVVYNDTYQHVGGAETYCLELLRHLPEMGHGAHWLAHGDKAAEAHNHIVVPISNDKGKFSYFQSKYFFNPAAYRQLKTELERLRPDVVHLHHDRYYTASLAKALKELRIPVVQTVHDYTMLCPSQYYPDLYYDTPSGKSRRNNCQLICSRGTCLPLASRLGHPFAHDRKRKAVRRRVRTFIAPSTRLKEYLERADFQNVHYLPFFVDEGRWAFHTERSMRNKVLFVGRVETNKGIHHLIQSILELRAEIPDIHLTIVGTGSQLGGINERIEREGLAGTIRTTGFVDYATIERYYESANVLVVPSLDMEQFGLIGIEALASGTAVIGSDMGGIPEWCIHGKTGLLFDPERPEQLTAQLRRMLREEGLAERLTEQGMDWLRKRYNKKEHFKELLKHYESARPME